MAASSTLCGKNNTPLARLTETIRTLTAPNFIGDDQSCANETQQPHQQPRQERGSNVNNVWIQTGPEAGGFSPPCQRRQRNGNNVQIQFNPEGGRDIIYDSDEDLNSDDEATSYADTLSVCLHTIAEDGNAESTKN